jgi:phosphosulfolactate synthase (CoM biosynthesis protein A)
MIDLGKAIKAINKTANFIITDENVDAIKWINNTTPISKEDILAKQAELQAAYDAKQYQRDRAVEYPTWQDQLDDIYHNGIDAWKDTIKVTKDKYPKS